MIIKNKKTIIAKIRLALNEYNIPNNYSKGSQSEC